MYVMDTIGLIGGMSWESTAEYYRLINEETARALGGLHSAECVLYSVDFATVEALQHSGDWTRLARLMVDAGQRLISAGASFIVVCTNTMHKMVPAMEAAGMEVLHIADVAGAEIRANGMSTVGLLGTRFTMEAGFYVDRLMDRFGIRTLIPAERDRELVHGVIYDELCAGDVRDSSREEFCAVIQALHDRGAEGVVLGCTEIPLLVRPEHTDVPLFDTTTLHAVAAVRRALREYGTQGHV